MSKRYTTNFLVDTNGNTGASGQVLISTSTGVNWSDGSGIAGGPYLPLDGGTMTGTNGVIFPNSFKLNLGASQQTSLYHDSSHLFIDNSVGTTYIRNTSNSGGGILLRNSTIGDIQFDNEFAGNIFFNTSNVTALTIDSSQNATFTGYVKVVGDIRGNGQQLVLNAGESHSYPTGQTGELVYLNAESGIQINSSPDNWATGWAGRKTAYINNSSGNSSFPGDTSIGGALTVAGSLTVGGDQYFNGTTIYGDNKAMFQYSDAWLRINPANSFTSGIYCGTGLLRTDGEFRVNDGNNFIVETSGKVGIGIVAPLSILHINAADPILLIKDTDTGGATANSRVRLAESGAAGVLDNYWDIGAGIAGTSDFDFSINEKTAGTLFTVLRNGHVGIGTTDPTQLLSISKLVADGDVSMLINNYDATVGSLNETVSLKFNHGNDGGNGYTGAKIVGGKEGDFETSTANVKGFMSFYTADGTSLTTQQERMRILGNGHVGIGTNDPDAKLHVYQGDAGTYTPNSQADTLVLEGANSSGLSIVTPDAYNSSIFFGSPSRQIGSRIGWNNNTNLFQIGTATTGASLAFSSGNWGEAIRIDSGGDVGIGTTNPNSKLDITGTTTTQKLNISAAEIDTISNYVLVQEGQAGPEIAVNGNFATDTDWTKGTGWTISGGTANSAGTSQDPIYQTMPTIIGNTYTVSFQITSITGGAVRIYAYVGPSGTFTQLGWYNTLGEHNVDFEFGGSNKIIRFYSTSYIGSNFVGSIDNVSVRETITASTSVINKRVLGSDAFISDGPYLPLTAGSTKPLTDTLYISKSTGANIILNSNTGAVSSGVYMTEGGTATPLVNGARVHYDGSGNLFKISTGTSTLTDRFTIARDTGAAIFSSTIASKIITVTAATSSPLLNLYNTSNGSGSIIRFSDQTSQTQIGDITFYHADGSSQGGGSSFVFTGEPDTTLVVGSTASGSGRVVVNSQGSATEVDYGFLADINTGMRRSAADTLRLTTGGTDAVILYSDQDAEFISKVGIGITPMELLDIQSASGDARIRLDAPSGSDTEIKFFNAAAAQYTIGHDDASDEFRIALGNVEDPIVSFTKSKNATFEGTIDSGAITSTGVITTPSGKITTLGGNNMTLAGTAANHSGLSFGTNIIFPSTPTAVNDAVFSLGDTAQRFKDLYLSGIATAATFSGDLNGTINTATLGFTQANATNNDTVATTAFVQNLIGTIPAGLRFEGTWDASSGTAPSASPENGQFWIVSVAGSTSLSGITDWKVGDWAIYVVDGAGADGWQKVDNSSVLDGSGTGGTLPLWSGSGTSNTLTNSIITQPNTNLIKILGADPMLLIQDSSTGTAQANSTLRLGESGSGGVLGVYWDIKQAPDALNTHLEINHSSYGNTVTVLSDGNVGIGTLTPDAQLEVESTSGAQTGTITNPATIRLSDNIPSATSTHDMVNQYASLEFYSNDASQGGARVRAKIGSVYEETYGTQTGLSFFTSTATGVASEKMRIDHDGNVGVGYTNPGQKLAVNGNIIIPQNSYLYFDNTAHYIRRGSSNVEIQGYNGINLKTQGSDRINILQAGNVGVNVTLPSEKLDVDGNVRIRSLTAGNVVSSSTGVLSIQSLPANGQNLSLGEGYAANIREKYYRTGKTVYPNDLGYKYASLLQQELLTDASLLMPSIATETSILNSVIPANGNGNFGFSRASGATRIDSEGLIAKERINLAIYSQDVSNAVYAKYDVTISTNTTIAPDGTSTADTITATAAGASTQGVVAVATSRIYTMSVYLKRKTGSGQVALRGVSNTATNITVTNDWQRFEVDLISPNTTGRYGVYLATSGDEVYAWGFQLELGQAASEYIQTLASAVTVGVTNNIPRIDYSEGDAALLLEPDRTNSISSSENFNVYPKQQLSVATNVAISPEGIMNACKAIPDTSNNIHILYKSSMGSGTSTVTQSVYAKADGYNFIFIRFDSATVMAWFDLENGTVGTAQTGLTTTIQEAGNGWYRCSATYAAPSSYVNAVLGVSNADNVGTFTGDGTKGVLVYGWQSEVGSYATSYIPTYGGNAVRANETIWLHNMQNNSVANGATSATLMMEFNHTYDNAGDVLIFRSSSIALGRGYLYVRQIGFADSWGSANLSVTDGVDTKVIWRLDSLSSGTFFKDGAKGNNVSGTAWGDIGQINIYGNYGTMRIKQLYLAPTALTNAQCVTLTTINQ